MAKIIHLSDLHFGTERSGVVPTLIEEIHRLQPDIVVISGDLTQRARQRQYRLAQSFLKEVSRYQLLCVPGNHDISLYNLFERLFFTFRKYKKWITPHLCSSIVYNNVALLGINSVTPYKPMGGYVSKQQLELVVNFFQKQPVDKIKIVVMHHNLIRSERHKIINASEDIIKVFAECNINLVLSGHIHYACIELLKRNFLKKNMYIITAGTATSTRTIAPNSFNILECKESQFTLTVKSLEHQQFIISSEAVYPF